MRFMNKLAIFALPSNVEERICYTRLEYRVLLKSEDAALYMSFPFSSFWQELVSQYFERVFSVMLNSNSTAVRKMPLSKLMQKAIASHIAMTDANLSAQVQISVQN